MRYLSQVVKMDPKDARSLFNLGNLFLDAHRLKEAQHCFEKSRALAPDNLAVQINLANILQRQGQLEAARDAYRVIVAEKPSLATGYFNLGVVESQLGNAIDAASLFDRALELKPDMSEARFQLARSLASQGQLGKAIEEFKKLVKQSPSNASAQRELGDLLQRVGAYKSAEKAYRAALKVDPDNAKTLYSLGTAQQQQALFDEAIDSYRKSIKVEPRQLEAYASLGNTLNQIGEVDQAIRQYQAALRLNPAFAHARLGVCISQLPIIYQSEEEIWSARDNYTRALDELHQHYSALSQEERARAASAVGFLQPFYLSYQGLPVRDLQIRYGSLISMLMAARYPEFVRSMEVPRDDGKIRLGVVSGFLRNHSSWNIFQGLFEAIDRDRFELYMFHTRTDGDRETSLLKHLCDGFVQGPMSISKWARTIRRQQLHAVFFPEFGMEATTIQLGCLRLAPVQFTSWGHPVTSGLETIDYYLSSEFMEPDNGQDDYSEKLVNLPHTSMHYRLPAVDPEPLSRGDLAVPENSVIYWCCQSLFKYLPQHDDVFPRIAKEVNNASFLFISMHGGTVEQRFRHRLEKAFAAEGLDMGKHCHFLSKLPKPTFAAMTALSDIFLDSIGWSGCNSAMEAIAADRPLLTLPGDFMRGRHCKSFLEMMGLEHLIAKTKDEYVELAIRLGLDANLRRSVSEQVRERKHRLYRDPEPVRALQEFLESAVAGSAAGQPSVDESPPEKFSFTEVSSAPVGEGRELWNEALGFQRDRKFRMAAEAFRTALELSNPKYAQVEERPLRSPERATDPGEERIVLAGIDYPAIQPLESGEPRPFWSVVVPVYNRDSYLLECLASVLAQWRGDDEMEIIVIDNGSEPALSELTQSIGKGIVRYHRHSETIPLQRNWNSAVSASRGRWIHLLHDDDYVLPGFYGTLKSGLENCPETMGAAFTAYENIGENNEVVFRNRVFGGQRGPARNWIEKIGVCNVLNPPAVVVRREAYERIGGYSDDILYTTDWELYLRLVSFFDWWYEPAFLVRYRQHALNITTEQNRAGAQGEAFWRAIEMASAYLPSHVRDRIVAKSRRYYFNWCLDRLRLPLQFGTADGAMRLLQQMVRIDQSEDSLRELFDWLGTSFATPLWTPLLELYEQLPEHQKLGADDMPGAVFDWLRLASAVDTRWAMANAIRNMPEAA